MPMASPRSQRGGPCRGTTRDADADAMAADRRLREAMIDYQRGGGDGFEEVYGRISPILKRYLLSMTGDPSRVEDLAQETFLQIHRARHTYDSSYPVTPWAIAIARHVFLMDRRYRNRRHEFARQPLEEIDSKTTEPHEHAFIVRSRLKDALGELSATTRRAVLLHHVCGLSFEEISRLLKVGNPALRCRTSRGLARMREKLTPAL